MRGKNMNLNSPELARYQEALRYGNPPEPSYVEDCVYYIVNVCIHELFNGDSVINFDSIDDFEGVDCFTYSDAVKMIEKYPHDFQNGFEALTLSEIEDRDSENNV